MFSIFILSLFFYFGISFKCPNYKDIQNPKLSKDFDIDKYKGTYYELALHNYTQPSICGCMRSNKTIINNNYIYDNFTLVCPLFSVVKK